MDIRVEKDIQHLANLVQTLSYELTVLYDFMKEKFGEEDINTYREQHLKSQPKQSEANNLQSRTISKFETVEHDDYSSGSFQMHDNVAVAIADLEEDCGTNYMEVESAVDCQYYIEGDDTIEASQKSSKRSSIWSKFRVTIQPDGRRHAECRNCHNPVSCKVERLRAHYSKCAGISFMNIAKEKVILEAKKEKPTQLKMEKRPVIPKKQCLFSEGDGDTSSPGRKLDPVWSYFHVSDPQDGKKLPVICKKCGVQVSNKVERARKHFILCNELDKEVESEEQGTSGHASTLIQPENITGKPEHVP